MCCHSHLILLLHLFPLRLHSFEFLFLFFDSGGFSATANGTAATTEAALRKAEEADGQKDDADELSSGECERLFCAVASQIGITGEQSDGMALDLIECIISASYFVA